MTTNKSVLSGLAAKGVPVLGDIGNTINEIDVLGTDKPLKQLVQEEKFFHEIVHVLVHEGQTIEDVPSIVLNVNGINQPVRRGTTTPMKRMFLEVLARMKETRYSQPPRDMMNVEAGNALVPRTLQAYPFQVVSDPNPKGAAWLQAVLAEA